MTTKFRVTYASGLTETEMVSDCATVDDYCNRKFGLPYAQVLENGTTVETPDIVPELTPEQVAAVLAAQQSKAEQPPELKEEPTKETTTVTSADVGDLSTVLGDAEQPKE